MGAVTIQQMADRIAELLEQKLRIKGRTLQDGLKKAGRRLPNKVRAAGERLAQAAERSHNPKLLLQLDEEAIANDYDLCLKHLMAVNVWEQRKGRLIGMTTSILFSLLVVAVLVIGVLMWRGYL